MTKCVDINLLYNDVGKLLNDICSFINEESNNGYISPKGKATAQLLIERSKQQLEVIATTVSDPSAESYVDMHGAKVKYDDQDLNNHQVYSDPSIFDFERSSNDSPLEENDVVCPFINTPAYKILDGKRGNVYRKEKILFFDKYKEVYACVQQPWLLIYNNDASMKPTQTFDLAHFQAKPLSAQLKDKRRNESFDLVSSSFSKIYRFIAHTEKDMLQWISAINNSVEKIHTKTNEPNDYDHDDLGDEYEILQTARKNGDQVFSKQPLLPPRNPSPKAKKKVSPIPFDEESYTEYDSVGPTRLSLNSFSDDDEDQQYDDPTILINQFSSKSKNEDSYDEDDEDNIYDTLQAPSQKQQPMPPPPPEPKPPVKPKVLLELRNSKKRF